ncbi:Uncharacterised protein [Salmonella enterica subsp. enterica serovar Bovismorbificans]|uniref:Uncharacterized protein n=1 Tax=Salmonella enterica subsp. enterica serovar Bovismorbificans TaxID=58097 RepID=A0A655CGD1_SALET|nr:Uncharacterised protein [Salmonella enterica subsp. enterica serovar Bovismorbificans]
MFIHARHQRIHRQQNADGQRDHRTSHKVDCLYHRMRRQAGPSFYSGEGGTDSLQEDQHDRHHNRQQRERQARQILLLFLFIVLLQRGIDFIGVQRARHEIRVAFIQPLRIEHNADHTGHRQRHPGQ